MPDDIQIRCLQTIGEREIEGLSDVLIDCVKGGASVGFMLLMTGAKAEGYWHSTSASVARGERVVLAAGDAAGTIVGTSGRRVTKGECWRGMKPVSSPIETGVWSS
jgi:propanediol dehydratase large subunit